MKCARPGCEKPVPEGRSRYCSTTCYKVVNLAAIKAKALARRRLQLMKLGLTDEQIDERIASWKITKIKVPEGKSKLPKLCEADGCTKPIPEGRRRYCSDACSTRMNKKAANARSRERAARQRVTRAEREDKDWAWRTCLGEKCNGNKKFWSAGAWNRICPECDKTRVYRGEHHIDRTVKEPLW